MAERCKDCRWFCQKIDLNENFSWPERGLHGDFIAEISDNTVIELNESGIRSCTLRETSNIFGKSSDKCLVPDEFQKREGNSEVASVSVNINLDRIENGKRKRI